MKKLLFGLIIIAWQGGQLSKVIAGAAAEAGL